MALAAQIGNKKRVEHSGTCLWAVKLGSMAGLDMEFESCGGFEAKSPTSTQFQIARPAVAGSEGRDDMRTFSRLISFT